VTWKVQDIEEAAEKVLAEVGREHSYRYKHRVDDEWTPVYQWRREPQCFVGHILNVLGVDMSDLGPCEGRNIMWVAEQLKLSISREAMILLENLQLLQDCREPWGFALDQARKGGEPIWWRGMS